jgi:manganese efflux pump family protein
VQLFNVVAIAVALAMDAFAVSIATGVCLKEVSVRQMFRLSWHFGLFQAMMPILGWSAGVNVHAYMASFGHWIAFGLLALIGMNMIREAFKTEECEAPQKDPTRGLSLVMLSLATSMDALAVGFSVSMLNISIWLPAIVIGVVAGAFTIFGLQIGKRIGAMTPIGFYAELLGGMVLLGIGANVLYQHGVFS